jgi:hypothetical protein
MFRKSFASSPMGNPALTSKLTPAHVEDMDASGTTMRMNAIAMLRALPDTILLHRLIRSSPCHPETWP